MDAAWKSAADALRAVRHPPTGWRDDRIPARPAGAREALAVGPGTDGDPRGGAHLSAGTWRFFDHPCRSAERTIRAVGDGGGPEMRRAGRRDRRAVGRPQSLGFHRDTAAGGGGREEWGPGLAGAIWNDPQFERGADALAGGERTEPGQYVRSTRAGRGGVGRGTVPGTRSGENGPFGEWFVFIRCAGALEGDA